MMILMKVLPAVPGHFSRYEWLALGSLGGFGRGPGPLARDRSAELETSKNGGKDGKTHGQSTEEKTPASVSIFWPAIHLLCGTRSSQSFDIVITNGHIIDGTGSPWYSGDVGIRGGKIAAIGNLSRAQRTRTIDAHGMVVAPGFIDMLGQSELTILVDPRLPSKIYQGITTEITGEGGSAAPLNDAIIQADQPGYEHYHDHSRLANLSAIFRSPGKTGHGHQSGQLRRRHTGAPHGAGRRRQAAHARRNWTR